MQNEDLKTLEQNAPEENKKKEKKENNKLNLILTIFQLLLMVACVSFSIVILASSGKVYYVEENGVKKYHASTGLSVVLSDSMQGTYNINDMIYISSASDDVKSGSDILDLGTRVSYFTNLNGRYSIDDKDHDGTDGKEKWVYGIVITHRIIGYQYKDSEGTKEYYFQGKKSFSEIKQADWEFKQYIVTGDLYLTWLHNYADVAVARDSSNVLLSVNSAEHRPLYVLQQDGSYLKSNLTMDDIKNDYRVYGYDKVMVPAGTKVDGVALTEEKELYVKNDTVISSITNAGVELVSPEAVLGTVSAEKGNSFVGSAIAWLKEPIWHYILIIWVPLILLFGYNVYIVIRIIVEEKQKKAIAEAVKEAEANKLDEEEIKRKAIEEYLASLNKEDKKEE